MDYSDFIIQFVSTIAAALIAVMIYDRYKMPRLKIIDAPSLEGLRSVNQELFRITIQNNGRLAALGCKLKIRFEGDETLPQKHGEYSSENSNKELSVIYPGDPEVIEIGWWGRKPNEHYHFNFKMMVGSSEIVGHNTIRGTLILLSTNAIAVQRSFYSVWNEKDNRYYFKLN